MSAPLANGSMNSNVARKVVSYTTTALKRWSCYSPRDLPPVSQVQALHVYDFDNTLFMSPLPNRKLWTGGTVGWLQNQDPLVNGGWWHDERILEATGEGIEKEEQKAWDGWWNENIVCDFALSDKTGADQAKVDLVRLSMKQDGALTVLLTGRAETNFAGVIRRIVASKQLIFDMICLKPQAGPNNQRFGSTMKYKQAILADLIHTYKDANEIRVYEDRPRHTQGFRDYLQDFNDSVISLTAPTPRKPIKAEVIQVADTLTTLDPVIETSEVQRMINSHNTTIRTDNPTNLLPYEIKRTVFFTGYLLSPTDGAKLVELLNRFYRLPENGTSYLANSILISVRPPAPSTLKRIGGWNFKQKWQVTGLGQFENKIWAARVAPVPANSNIHTETPVPLVVLAMTRNARPIDANRIQHWQAINSADDPPIFETTVGEKVQLRVEPEGEADSDREDPGYNELKRLYLHENGRDRPFRPNRGGYNNDENRRPSGPGNFRGGFQNRGRAGNGPAGGANRGRGRGGGGGGGAGNRGGNARGRGRGGYRSLDDIGSGNDRYVGQGRNQHQNHNDGPGGHGDGYKSAFPPLGGGDGAGDGGLSY